MYCLLGLFVCRWVVYTLISPSCWVIMEEGCHNGFVLNALFMKIKDENEVLWLKYLRFNEIVHCLYRKWAGEGQVRNGDDFK